VCAAGLAALALWQAGSLKVGGLFAAGLAAAMALLAGCARLVVAAARRNRGGSLTWRQAVANVHRPGSQAAAVLIAGGLAVMLIVCVSLLERRLVQELSGAHADEAPAFFFIDIQPDQAVPFRELLARSTGKPPLELIPAVRSRLAAIDGRRIAPESKAGREGTWYLSREYVLTWADEPPSHNAVVAGRWWSAEEAAREPLISVEDELAKQLGVNLGGTLTFDIQGISVTGRVSNLRRVDWESFNSNFFVIFSPGALDGAPMTYIATAQVPPAQESRVQSDVVAAFGNITAIPVREVLERAAAILDQIAVALRLVAGASVLSGLVVMAGALGVTRVERLYQSVILKALGATRGFVARVFAVEYLLLGAAAGVTGTALAAALAWAVLRFALDLSWRWTPGTLVAGTLVAMALALAVGFLGTYRLLGRSPLSVLRSE
jgi:putative ABC transport system permease protein